MMEKYEADLQFKLKEKGADDANITTGYVKAF